MSINVTRHPLRFEPDSGRTIPRFFLPGNAQEVIPIVQNIIAMSDEVVNEVLGRTLRSFAPRHRKISSVFESHFKHLAHVLADSGLPFDSLSEDRRFLIGAYFTNEYSIESAALFNPSVVLDPDQQDLESGQKRLIMSLRATGEGHISSIVFRRVIVGADGKLTAVDPGRFTDQANRVKRYTYDKKVFSHKLEEMEIYKDVVSEIMGRLGDTFTYGQLSESIEATLRGDGLSYSRKQVIESIKWLADSHYEITFDRDTELSERVIFPTSTSETNGIEDARFVRFVDDDGTVDYYATYTAYNGFTILPKLLRTRDFLHFEVKPLHGECARNKGMALFPRKIAGKYAMLSRMDGINNYLMYSDNVILWNQAVQIQAPTRPWELVKVGNAGPPLETPRGWLVITHGIGPVREYSLGAMLLDLDDPSKVLRSLKEPLLRPNEQERDGYVPNVVYSCGAIIHNGELILPYAVSDQASTVASIPVEDLIDAMEEPEQS